MAPHRHLVVDVTVTSARTNTNVHRIGARLPLSGKLDADLCTSALLRTFGPVCPCLISLRYERGGPVGAYGG
jgi:hypothetical protein